MHANVQLKQTTRRFFKCLLKWNFTRSLDMSYSNSQICWDCFRMCKISWLKTCSQSNQSIKRMYFKFLNFLKNSHKRIAEISWRSCIKNFRIQRVHYLCLLLCYYVKFVLLVLRPCGSRFFYSFRGVPIITLKGFIFDLYSAILVIEQWGFYNVLHLLWNGSTVYNGNLRGPVTLKHIAMRTSYVCPDRGLNPDIPHVNR